jgi:hypothetical protein
MIVVIKLSGSVDHISDDANPFPIIKNLPRSYWNVDFEIISVGICVLLASVDGCTWFDGVDQRHGIYHHLP